MRNDDRIITIFGFLFGLYVVREGYVLPVGTLREPGTGFLLFWSGRVLSGLSAFTFVRCAIHRHPFNAMARIYRGKGVYELGYKTAA